MTLSNGRPYLAIPGPSVMPDRVLAAMQRPAPNIYSGALVDMVETIVPDLCAVARTRHDVAIYVGNGHAAWEAAVANVAGPGDTVLVPATGRFGFGWAEMAQKLGVTAETLDFGKKSPVDMQVLAARLARDTGHDIKAVMAVQTDTSTSIRNDIASMRKVLDELGHPALLMVDCIASMGCDRFEMDAWGVDVALTGSQKGLMTPPGLSFVFFNDRADAVRDRMKRVSHYWDWRPRARPEFFYEYFCGTAPTHHLFALRAALDMIAEEGLEAIWARHALLARAVWAALETWAQDGPLEMNVADPALRSHAVTSVSLGAPQGTELRTWLEQRAGVTLGIGLGMALPDDPAWHGYFRIGHMGHVNAHMVMGALGAIEAGLQALAVPHGPGALEAAAGVLAQA